MERPSSVKSKIISLLTLVFASSISFRAHAQSFESREEHIKRIALAAEHIFIRHEKDIQSELRKFSSHSILLSSLAELDGEGAGKALMDICSANIFVDCILFDSEGEFLADNKGREASENKISNIKVSTGDVLFNIEPLEKSLGMVMTSVLMESGANIGFIRVSKSFDKVLCNDIASLVGDMVVLWHPKFGLVCTSADGETEKFFIQSFEKIQPKNSESYDFGGSDFTFVSFLGKETDEKIYVGVRQTKATASSGAISFKQVASFVSAATILLMAILIFSRRKQKHTFKIIRSEMERLDPVNCFKVELKFAEISNDAQLLVSVIEAKLNIAIDAITVLKKDRQQIDGRLAKVAELLRIGEGAFSIFVAKAKSFNEHAVAALRELELGGNSKELAAEILRLTHTIKSNARLFKLNQINLLAKELEDVLAGVIRQTTQDESFGKIANHYIELIMSEIDGYRDLRSRIFPSANDDGAIQGRERLRSVWILTIADRIFTWLKNPKRDPIVAGRIHSEFQSAVSSVGKEDLNEYVRLYDRMLTDLSVTYSKKIQPIKVDGNYQYFSYETMQELHDVFLHCLRNAFDHAIELPSARQAGGKNQAGRISIESNFYAGICSIIVRDDGKGIDIEVLRRKAVERNLYSIGEAKNLTDRQLLDLVFKNGFSTSKQVNDLSGRGVGMNAVRQIVERLGGEVWLETELGVGSAVHLHFPISHARYESRQGLFNPISAIEQILASTVLYTSQLSVSLHVSPFLRKHAMVVCDRYLFSEAMRIMILQVATSGANKLEFSLEHDSNNGHCSLDTFILRVSAEVTTKGSSKKELNVDLGYESALFGILAEAGIIIDHDIQEQGELLFKLNSGTGGLLTNKNIRVWVPESSMKDITTLFLQVSESHFASVNLELKDISKFKLDDSDSSTELYNDIYVIDDKVLSDNRLFTELKSVQLASILMITDKVEAINRERLFALSVQPIIVEGKLDLESASNSIENNLLRRLAKLSAGDMPIRKNDVA